MKKFATLALAASLSQTGVYADNYDLVYDYTDGSLTVVTTGGMYYYNLESSQSPFLSANHQLFASIQEIAPGLFVRTGYFISDPDHLYDAMNVDTARSGYTIPPGVYNIGNVLPANLTEQEFNNLFDRSAVYVPRIDDRGEVFDFVYVPEPTALAVMSIGGLMAFRRRKDV